MTYEKFITSLRSTALEEFDSLLPDAGPNDRRRFGAEIRKALLNNIPRYEWKRNGLNKEWLNHTEYQVRASVIGIVQDSYIAHVCDSEVVKSFTDDYAFDVERLSSVDMDAVWRDAAEIINNDPSPNGTKQAANLIIGVRGEMMEALITRTEIEARKYGARGVKACRENARPMRRELNEWAERMLQMANEAAEGSLNMMRSADAEFMGTLTDIFGLQ